MTNRNRYYRQERQRHQQGYDPNQPEQYASGGYGDPSPYAQMGDTHSDAHGQMETDHDPYDGDRRSSEERMRARHQRTYDRGYQTSSYGEPDPRGGFGGAHPANREYRGFRSFSGNDFGGQDFSAPGRNGNYAAGFGSGAGRYGAGTEGAAPRSDYSNNDRGFFERAGDEVASWFGDEEAARRREMDHSGRGPTDYTRSDQRILEDACDNLTDDWGVDATNVRVTVENGEVTLDGTVSSRQQKRRAEDCVDRISGVGHVQNNLRVQQVGEDAQHKTSGSLA